MISNGYFEFKFSTQLSIVIFKNWYLFLHLKVNLDINNVNMLIQATSMIPYVVTIDQLVLCDHSLTCY